jgi:hypothetical protein
MRAINPIGILAGCEIAVLVAAFACARTEPPEPAFGSPVQRICPQRGTPDYSFEPTSVAADRIVDRYLRAEYSHLLTEMEGDPLWCGTEAPDSYRFFWLPAHSAPLVVSLSQAPRGWLAHAAEFRTLSQHPPDPRPAMRVRIANRIERNLDASAISAFIKAIDSARFWTAPSFAGGGEDGYFWSIEARRGGRYRIVTRLNANDEQFEEAARNLVRLSGLPLPQGMDGR